MLSTSVLPSPHLRRHREHARRLLPSLVLLTDERDRADPAGSRETIEEYVAHLRERTRNSSSFPVVCDANADYGFRRNVLALRAIGIASSAVAAATACGALGAVAAGLLDRTPTLLGLAIFADAVGGVWWWRLSDSWVRVQATRYANALLDGADLLDRVNRNTSA